MSRAGFVETLTTPMDYNNYFFFLLSGVICEIHPEHAGRPEQKKGPHVPYSFIDTARCSLLLLIIHYYNDSARYLLIMRFWTITIEKYGSARELESRND